MKRLIISIIATVLIAGACYGQKLIGLYGGANTSWMYFGKSEYETHIFGYTIPAKSGSIWRVGGDWGMMAQMKVFDDLLFKTGVGFSKRGIDDVYTSEGTTYYLRVGLLYADLPLMLHWYTRLEGYKNRFITLGGGLQLSLLSGNSVKKRTEGGIWTSANHVEAFTNYDVAAVLNSSLQIKEFFFELGGGLSLISPMEGLRGAFPVFMQLRVGYFIYGD